MIRRSNFVTAGVALVALAFWMGWLRGPQLKPAPGKKSPTATAQRDSVKPRLLLSGEITPAFRVDLKPEVGGKVKVIHVTAGQQVKKGDILVTVDGTDLLNEKAAVQTEIEGARLSVDKSRGNYERARALFDQKLISKEVFANLESDFKIAENTLEKAERKLQTVDDRLSKTQILAPSNGTVLDVYVNEGQVVVAAASVNSGTSLMLFADLDRLLIYTHVNQMDVGFLSVGTGMDVQFTNAELATIPARIEFIAPVATVKNNIKGFEVQAVIEGNEGRLKPGMSVSMEVAVGHADRVVTVPIAAVFKEKDSNVVYVRKGTQIQKRQVAVGLTDLSRAEIKSGIREGEEILLVEPVGALLEKS